MRQVLDSIRACLPPHRRQALDHIFRHHVSWHRRLMLLQSLIIGCLLWALAMMRRMQLRTPPSSSVEPRRRSSLAFATPPTDLEAATGMVAVKARLSITQCLDWGEDPVAPVLHALQLACKQIAAEVRGGAQLQPSGGRSGDVLMLNRRAHEIFVAHLDHCSAVALLLSEPSEQVTEFERDDKHRAKYAVVCDPLDGASNIAAGVATGSIFGIYRASSIKQLLLPGHRLQAAGYAMYSGATTLVVARPSVLMRLNQGPPAGGPVQGFVLDHSSQEFVRTQSSIRIPRSGLVYSINEGRCNLWHPACRKFVEDLRSRSKRSLRYVGTMVADVHRTLWYGGIFMYPSEPSKAAGKLRLMYEVNPLSFVIELAGGLATNGKERVLHVQPQSLHQRSPVFLGSWDDVQQLQECYDNHKSEQPDMSPCSLMDSLTDSLTDSP